MISRPRWIAALLLAAVLATVWAAQRQSRSTTPSATAPPAVVDMAVSGQSLYQLTSAWTTDADRVIQLRELHGRYVVVALIFTSCTSTCPLVVKELKIFADAMPQNIKKQTCFLLVTLDPHDSTTVLRRYRQEMRLDERQWTLLRGSPDAVREFAAVLGINYEAIDAQQFLHTNLVTLLNPQGEIVHQQQGAGGDMRELLAAIGKAR